MLDSDSGSPTASTRWAFVALLVFACIAGMFEVHNLDVPLHDATGAWILEHGEVPTTNVLSHIHRDHAMVADKWLFQVGAHLLNESFGVAGLMTARLALVLALAGLMALLARARGVGPASLLALCVVGLVATRVRLFFRPDLVSLVFVALVAWTLLAPGRRTTPWWLIALQVVWVNVHGYFTLGPLVVGAVAAGHMFGSPDDRHRARSLFVLAALLVVACFANPSGWRGAYHPIAILADLRAHYEFYTATIIEFFPTFGDDPRNPYDRLAFFVLLPIAALALVADVVRRPRSPDAWSALFVALGLGAMTVSLRRNMSPFAVVVAPLSAAAITSLTAGFGRTAHRAGAAGAITLALVAGYGELSDHTSIHDGLDRRWGWGRSSLAYPDECIDFITEHLGNRESVFTSFSIGSSFTGARYPEQTAVTDGNTHGYPTTHLQDVIGAVSQQRPEAFDEIVERYDLSVALLGAATPLSIALLSDERWTLVFLGRLNAVYVRRDSVDASWLAEHDKEALLKRGTVPPRGVTPSPRSRFGLPVAHQPIAESTQALLFTGGGFVDVARRVIAEGLESAPDDITSVAIAGLLALRAGDTATARTFLERAEASDEHFAFRDAVREALARLND